MTAEFVGTAFLLMVAVGSGIMGERLAMALSAWIRNAPKV
jgi:glycerol uptake facilitator-like aquaporin